METHAGPAARHRSNPDQGVQPPALGLVGCQSSFVDQYLVDADVAEGGVGVGRRCRVDAVAEPVGRPVALSIVGIDGSGFGYHRAELAHERAARAGLLPADPTQLHEFVAQLLTMTGDGGRAGAFDVAVQTVAASAVAEALVTAAEHDPRDAHPMSPGPSGPTSPTSSVASWTISPCPSA